MAQKALALLWRATALRQSAISGCLNNNTIIYNAEDPKELPSFSQSYDCSTMYGLDFLCLFFPHWIVWAFLEKLNSLPPKEFGK